jgi:hypothetical protein
MDETMRATCAVALSFLSSAPLSVAQGPVAAQPVLKPVYVEKGLGRIDAILDDHGTLVVVGFNGVAERGAEGKWEFRPWPPAPLAGGVVPVDLNEDGSLEFVRYSSDRNVGISVVDAFSRDGEKLWTFRPVFPEQDRVAGQLLRIVPGRSPEGAQRLRLLAGHNSKVLLLDTEGHAAGFEQWSVPNAMAFMAIPEPGGYAILYGSDSRLECRGADGTKRFERDFSSDTVRAYVSRIDRLTASEGRPRANVYVSARERAGQARRDQDYELIVPPGANSIFTPWTDAEFVGQMDGPEINGLRLAYSFIDRNVLCVNGFNAARELVFQAPLARIPEYSIAQKPADSAMMLTSDPEGRVSVVVGAGCGVWRLDSGFVKAGPVMPLEPLPK